MTLEGTNTYVVDAGRNEAVIIDPGPDLPAHIDAIEATVRGWKLKVSAILVTHGHPDHAPGAATLARRCGAGVRVWAHPAARFPHSASCLEGDRIAAGDISFLTIEAPGHADDHVVYWLASERALFTGDVVIGRGTVVISPPHGDMRQYQATLRRLRDEFSEAETIYGGHGERIDDPIERINEYIDHRERRERQVLTALGFGRQTIPQLTERIYAELPRVLWPAAARQILAYLIALEREGRVHSVALNRAPTASEAVILDPDLRKIADPGEVELVRSELGLDERIEMRSYELRH
jgi:glyoxylase-like metal-dependent hydrolase (beta-lactamase superfamily II)